MTEATEAMIEAEPPPLPEKPEHHFYAYALGLLRAQRRMLDRWSEGDAAVRQRLWRDLHARGDDLFEALSAPPQQDVRARTIEGTATALLAKLDQMFPPSGNKPTIEELERILAAGNQGAVEIKPDGSLTVMPRPEIEALRRALTLPGQDEGERI